MKKITLQLDSIHKDIDEKYELLATLTKKEFAAVIQHLSDKKKAINNAKF